MMGVGVIHRLRPAIDDERSLVMKANLLSLLIAGAALVAPALTPAQSQGVAQSGGQGVSVPELRRNFPSVQAAVDAIGEGQGTVLLAPGLYRECAVQTQGVIQFVSREPGRAIFDGTACEGKAALVLRGNGAHVTGIIFQNITVSDRNGAGIRLERGNLTVEQAMFRNSDEGILAGDDPSATVRIEQSTFSSLGRNDGGPSHSIYIGNFGRLIVNRSRFERGTGGHYVKFRGPQVQITDNSFDDTMGRETNYMVDLTKGASGQVTGNLFIQGQNKENYSAFIAVAPEGRDNSSAGLTISGNTARLAPGVDRNTVFVANWSGQRLNLGNNAVGAGLRAYEER